MRVPWFNWLNSRGDEASKALICVPQRRTDVEIDLALCLIPDYAVVMRIDDPLSPLQRCWPITWLQTLTLSLGSERAQQALHNIREHGYARLAVCPLESAEHYCDELTRLNLPCHVALA